MIQRLDSLNQLQSKTTIFQVRKKLIISSYIEVFVDTVGPKDSYQTKLIGVFKLIQNNLQFTVSEKADSKFKVVSAASICAKVTRDFEIKNWKFIENIKAIDKNYGSGYTSDPNT